MPSATTETRPPGPWVLIAVVALSLVITSVYVREGPSGPVHLVRRGTQAVAGPVARAGDILTLPFRAAAGWLGGFTISRQEVDQLRVQNAELRKRSAELEEAALENERLRQLVKFAEASDLEAKGAHVIGRPSSSWEGVLVIDVGVEDSITVGMPVLAAQGLVGQVVEVSRGSSRVRLLTDQRSGAAALVQSTRAAGIVHGSAEGALTLDFIDRRLAPKAGDVVLTSGLGGVYPKGLVIGEVGEVDLAPSDLYPHVGVTSHVPFSTLEEVLVLLAQPPSLDQGVVE